MTQHASMPTEAAVRIVVADDHPVVLLGVRAILASAPEMAVVGEATDGDEAVRLTRELEPDVLLLDLAMPKLPGLESLRELTTASSPVKTMLLTGNIERRQILEALQLGARGVVLKHAAGDELIRGIKAVMGGQYWLGGGPVTNLVTVLNELRAETPVEPRTTFGLTPRELEVVKLVVSGGTNKDIASALGISEETVKRHLTHTFDKTGVSTRLELALFAMHHLPVGEDGALA